MNQQVTADMPRIDDAVEKYVKLRDFKEKINAELKEKVAKVDDAMEKIELEIMTFLNATGQDSAKTAAGTAFKKTVTRVSVADWDVALAYIQDNDMFNLLNHSMNKTAVEEFIEANKAVPPGVNVERITEVAVHRPKTR